MFGTFPTNFKKKGHDYLVDSTQLFMIHETIGFWILSYKTIAVLSSFHTVQQFRTKNFGFDASLDSNFVWLPPS